MLDKVDLLLGSHRRVGKKGQTKSTRPLLAEFAHVRSADGGQGWALTRGSSLNRSNNNENKVTGSACTDFSGGWQVQFWACPSLVHILSHHCVCMVCFAHTRVIRLKAWTGLYPLYTSRPPQRLAPMSLSSGLAHHSSWHLGEETEARNDRGPLPGPQDEKLLRASSQASSFSQPCPPPTKKVSRKGSAGGRPRWLSGWLWNMIGPKARLYQKTFAPEKLV